MKGDLTGGRDRFILSVWCVSGKEALRSCQELSITEQVRSNDQSSGREACGLPSAPSGCFCKINDGKLRQEEPCAHMEMTDSLLLEVITITLVYSELCTVLSSPVAHDYLCPFDLTQSLLEEI